MERVLYSHDIAAIPSLIAPLIGKTVPDAVVQPQNEEELVNLINWARQRNIALTPRAKASSGYGGVLPVKQGIVVDFFRLNKILSIDKQAQTVTCKPVLSGESGRRVGQRGANRQYVSIKLSWFYRGRLAGARRRWFRFLSIWLV